MSRLAHRDPTAEKAIGNADRGTMKRHAPGCWVNGGPSHHGSRGFRCAKCGGSPERRVETLLMELDKAAGGRW